MPPRFFFQGQNCQNNSFEEKEENIDCHLKIILNSILQKLGEDQQGKNFYSCNLRGNDTTQCDTQRNDALPNRHK